jgi:hypothetical protein
VRRRGAPVTRWAAILAAASSVGCGGGAALLHPARTLDAWQVRAAGGVSANFVPSTLGNELNAARAESPTPQPPTSMQPTVYPTDATYAKGVLVAALVSPGVAPFVSGRVGVGQGFEAGLTYTGRSVRADFRHAWSWDKLSLSLGGGLSYLFYGDDSAAGLPGIDVDGTQGFGADVPVLFGWDSRAHIFSAWVGVRGGFDHAVIPQYDGMTLPSTLSSAVSATRFYGGGLVGLAAGFRHVHVALEFDAAYQTVAGAFYSTSTTVSGLTLAPAAAVWVDF